MIAPTNRTKAKWLADLAQSEAEADAGVTVPLAPALERARAAARRLEAKARQTAPRAKSRPLILSLDRLFSPYGRHQEKRPGRMVGNPRGE